MVGKTGKEARHRSSWKDSKLSAGFGRCSFSSREILRIVQEKECLLACLEIVSFLLLFYLILSMDKW